MSDAKAVVTGGAGFIGSHLVRALLGLGKKVHVVDDLSFGQRIRVPEAAALHQLDIRDVGALEKVFQGADSVFHLAAISSVVISLEDPVRVHSVNAMGTVCVLDAARRSGVRRVIYSSSSAVYGNQAGAGLGEDTPAVPQSPYGLSKYEGELSCRLFSDLFNLETVALRYFNVFGPGQDPRGPYAAVIARFIEARQKGHPLEVTGDGRQTRDFIAVEDVVRANLAAAHSQRIGRGEAINIGTGKKTSIYELARFVGGEIKYVEQRAEIRDSCGDIGKAKDLMGFAAEIELQDGLKRMFGSA
jgi:UDP-glucose 4-epimerase